MDVFMIIVTIVLTILLIICNIYFVAYFLEPNEKGFADSWFCKVLVVTHKQIVGLMLAQGQVLILPLDVSNSRGEGMGLDISVFWQIVYMLVFLMILIFLPAAMFYYESEDDDKSLRQRIWYVAKHMIFLLIIIALILGCMYGLVGVSRIPFRAYACQYSNNEPSNNQLVNTDCDDSEEELDIDVTFPIYVMGMMSFVGWWLVVVFGGIGLSAIPLDFLNKWRFKPQRVTHIQLTPRELEEKKLSLSFKAQRLRETGETLRLTKSSIETATSWLKKRTYKNELRRGMNQLTAETILLEKEYEIYKIEKGVAQINPLWYPFYVFMAFLTGVVSFLWLLHILLYVAIRDNLGVPAHPFLNNFFIALEFPGVSFIGTTIYCAFVMYLLLACIKGNIKFGLRFFCCCQAHPIKRDGTPMNSMLFNTCLILLCSVSVTLFSSNAFAMYTRLSDINNMFGVQVRYLDFFRYFYDNSVFEIMLLSWSLLTMLFLCWKSKDDSPKSQYDEQYERDKLRFAEKNKV